MNLLHLDQYLEKFVSNAESHGARFHGLAMRPRRIRSFATGTSARRAPSSEQGMTTEETHLNVAPDRPDQVVEVDLGEYIIQLAEETRHTSSFRTTKRRVGSRALYRNAAYHQLTAWQNRERSN